MEQTSPALRPVIVRHRRPFSRTTLALLLVSLPMLLYLLFPILAMILRVNPAMLMGNLTNPEVGQAVWLSLVTTACSTALGLGFGTPLA